MSRYYYYSVICIALSLLIPACSQNSVDPNNEPPPDSFEVKQQYPNPFIPSTLIEYSLSQQSDVYIIVYDTMGEQVAILIDKEQPAGDYQVEWDGCYSNGEEAPSGIYFYRIITDNFTIVKKLLLLRD